MILAKLSQLRSQCLDANLNHGICAINLHSIYLYIYLLGLPAMQKGYGSTWMQEAVCEAYAAAVEVSGPNAEFNAYLNSAPQATMDVVSWWGVCDLFIMNPLIFLSPCSGK